MSSISQRIIVGTLLVAASAGMIYTLQRMDADMPAVAATNQALPRYTLEQAQLTRYDAEGAPALLADARTIDYFDDESARADDIAIDALGVGGAPWHLTSPVATLPAHQRRFELHTPVDIAGRWPDNGEELTARTDHLWVDPDAHEFETDAAVTFESEDRSGSSIGLRADWLDRNLKLLREVRMIYKAPAHD